MDATKHITSIFYLLLFICLLTSSTTIEAENTIHAGTTIEAENTIENVISGPPGLIPMGMGRREYRMMMEMDGGGPRRKLGPFQVCLVCRCCVVASDPTTCSNMPCCFGIDCQLPNKPFGVCAFVPKTCNCTTCAS